MKRKKARIICQVCHEERWSHTVGSRRCFACAKREQRKLWYSSGYKNIAAVLCGPVDEAERKRRIEIYEQRVNDQTQQSLFEGLEDIQKGASKDYGGAGSVAVELRPLKSGVLTKGVRR